MKQINETTFTSDNGLITFINGDCMEFMAGCMENEFDLNVSDPPYGLGKRTTDGGSKKNTQTKFVKDIRRTNWDDAMPSKECFDKIFYTSKNQIIWGGNYFGLPAHRTFIVWDKMTYVPTMSQVEMAWTSFDSPARLIKINSNQLDRFHPTAKPIDLYRWIFANYTKPTDSILDCFGGSMSSAIAAHIEGLRMTIIELDKEYFDKAIQRFSIYEQQQTINFE